MITHIESADNAKLKLIKRLAHKKHRDREDLFVVEGANAVLGAATAGAEIEFVIISDDRPELLEEISDTVDAHKLCSIDRDLYESISDAQNGSGAIAVVHKTLVSLNDMRNFIAQSDNLLVLDRIQDPGNFGTMVRTAVATGYAAVFAIKGSADVYSPKVLRATAGTVFTIPIIYVEDVEELVDFLHSMGKRIVVTHPSGGTPYYESDLLADIALVIGNEGNGVSEEMLAACDVRITIPMRGDIESLNAAISAAILMYEAIRDARN